MSRFSKHCNAIAAHEMLAICMAFLVRVWPLCCQVHSLDRSHSGRCMLRTPARSSGLLSTKNLGRLEKSARSLAGSVLLSALFLPPWAHLTNFNNIERVLTQVYRQDLSTYPPENQSLLSDAHPTTFQTDMDSVVHQRRGRRLDSSG